MPSFWLGTYYSCKQRARQHGYGGMAELAELGANFEIKPKRLRVPSQAWHGS